MCFYWDGQLPYALQLVSTRARIQPSSVFIQSQGFSITTSCLQKPEKYLGPHRSFSFSDHKVLDPKTLPSFFTHRIPQGQGHGCPLAVGQKAGVSAGWHPRKRGWVLLASSHFLLCPSAVSLSQTPTSPEPQWSKEGRKTVQAGTLRTCSWMGILVGCWVYLECPGAILGRHTSYGNNEAAKKKKKTS